MLPMANSLALLPPPPGHPTLGISAQGPPPGYTYPDPYPTLYIHSMPPLQPLDIPSISPLWWGLVGSGGDWWGGTSRGTPFGGWAPGTMLWGEDAKVLDCLPWAPFGRPIW